MPLLIRNKLGSPNDSVSQYTYAEQVPYQTSITFGGRCGGPHFLPGYIEVIARDTGTTCLARCAWPELLALSVAFDDGPEVAEERVSNLPAEEAESGHNNRAGEAAKA